MRKPGTLQKIQFGKIHGGDLLGDEGNHLGDSGDLLGDGVDILGDGVNHLGEGGDLLGDGANHLGDGGDLLATGVNLLGGSGNLLCDGVDLLGDGVAHLVGVEQNRNRNFEQKPKLVPAPSENRKYRHTGNNFQEESRENIFFLYIYSKSER